MSNAKVYGLLEDKMLRYADLSEVPVEPRYDRMVCVADSIKLRVNPIDPNMAAFTGNAIYLRQVASVRLGRAANMLLNITDPIPLPPSLAAKPGLIVSSFAE